jgi:hypothetical protein
LHFALFPFLVLSFTGIYLNSQVDILSGIIFNDENKVKGQKAKVKGQKFMVTNGLQKEESAK